MASTPRASLDDSYILGITCAICGADALSVNHVPNLPDYVTCSECNSAFLVEEGGDRVFYGQIATGYEDTERFALKQWAWLEAIETRAREERPRLEGEQVFPDPETIEESLDEEPEAEPLSAEEWISSEIPAVDLRAEIEGAGEADLLDMERIAEAPELETEIGEETFAMTKEPAPFEDLDLAVDETGEDIGSPVAEEQGLADFFDALTDEGAPDAEPDVVAVLEEPETPLMSDLDDDLEKLLKTEDDTGPELAPPPWVSKTEDEFTGVSDESEDEVLPAWDDIEASKPQSALDAAPDIPAWESAEESEPQVDLPSWEDLEEPEAEAEDLELETPAWALTTEEEEQTEDLPAWASFDDQAPAPLSESEPETPDWALPSEEPSLSAFEAEEGMGGPAWDAEDREEPSPVWEDVSGALADEAVEDEDDFLSGLRRSAAVPLESEPIGDQPLVDDEFESDMAWEEEVDVSARIQSFSQPAEAPEPVAAGWEMTAAAAVAQAAPQPEPEPVPIPAKPLLDEDYVPPPSDPPPGQRSRVVLKGERVIFPSGDCAHCGRTPTKGKLAVAGTLPRGQTVGQRRPTRFEIPLCASCRNRAAAKSEDAKAAQLQAHLISGIVGMVLVVGALALDIINPRDLSMVDFFLGLILLIVGYGGPAYFLLNRVGNYLPPVDARYVRTTLLVPQETQGLETAFEWRNQEYAQRFHDANQPNVLGNVTSVKDRMA